MKYFPKSITTVTLFSKILATIILVLIIPMASFYAGMQYEKAAIIAQFELPTIVTHGQQLSITAEKLMRDYLTKYTLPTSLPSQRISEFKLYHAHDIVEENNELTFQITYAVHPFSKQADAFWLSGTGSLDANGWVVGKTVLVKAEKKNGFYQITSMTPEK